VNDVSFDLPDGWTEDPGLMPCVTAVCESYEACDSLAGYVADEGLTAGDASPAKDGA